MGVAGEGFRGTWQLQSSAVRALESVSQAWIPVGRRVVAVIMVITFNTTDSLPLPYAHNTQFTSSPVARVVRHEYIDHGGGTTLSARSFSQAVQPYWSLFASSYADSGMK